MKFFSRNKSNYNLWNIYMFIISFTLINLVRGIVFDSYINYLQELAPGVAMSFSTYQGMATLISAVLILFIYRLGFKWTLILCPLSALFALVSILIFPTGPIFYYMTIILLVSIQLFRAILPPFMTSYTNPRNRTEWYSRSFWLGYFGWASSTFLGGLLTVNRFSKRLKIPFSKAKLLTQNIADLSPSMRNHYILANEDILLLTAILAALAIVPLLFIREDRSSFRSQADITGFKGLSGLINKDSIMFLIYISLVNFAMGLFAPYFTVFLNRTLHIDRSTSSLLVSLSYMATVFFIMAGPKLIYRFGQTKTLGSCVLLSLPFMLLIAGADSFPRYMIPLVGISLFMRSGLANLAEPVESSLPMELVTKENRTAMASITNIITGLMSILSGAFTGRFLFQMDSGYRYGYYIATSIYLVTSSIMIFYFSKEYNHIKKE